MVFIRNKEDFVCEHCGVLVIGDGYTNHCPACLWCKHVDIDPGDRAATCGALMEPTELIISNKGEVIVHVCTKCGFTRKNKVSPHDSRLSIVKLSAGIVE